MKILIGFILGMLMGQAAANPETMVPLNVMPDHVNDLIWSLGFIVMIFAMFMLVYVAGSSVFFVIDRLSNKKIQKGESCHF